ncbi:hypothetical protein RclHR1_24070001 [Rhizophagus clarus]|uniref:Uncharacterized protein n=1 Tax=Rhizophagus clarus TaxID=94130 RepID=A0A2Z6RRS0_9GLOM|nr:hypothetical protein RclHR1_24070001 [Rhizophagus clarus]
MRPWTLFQRSGTPLKVDYDISKVWNSLEINQYFEGLKLFRGRSVFQRCPELFKGGPVQNFLEVDRYFEVQNFLETDWYFEGLEFRGRPGFQRSETRSKLKVRKKWTESSYFKGLDLPIRSRPGYFKVFSWNLILRQTRFVAFRYFLD